MTESVDRRPISPLRIALIYTVLAGTWIVASDLFMGWLLGVPAQFSQVNMLKGGTFVIATALLLYVLLQRRVAAPLAVTTSLHGLLLPLAAGSAIIIGITVGLALNTLEQKEHAEVARLQAVSKLKTEQVSIWLRERLSDARLLQSSHSIPAAYQHWRQQGDRGSRDDLFGRLSAYRKEGSFQGVLLLDEHGAPLWSTSVLTNEPTDQIGPAEIKRFLAAATPDNPTRLGPYRDTAGRIHLDFVLRLALPGGQPGPIIVLQSDAENYFPVAHGTWPVPTASGDVFLFKRDGDHVIYLSPLRHQADALLKLRLPLANSQFLAAQVLNEPGKVGQLIKGVDYRNQEVAGVARAIPGTDWFLMTKLDRQEMMAEARRDVSGIVLSGLLLLFAAGAGLMTLRQRQQLAFAQDLQQAQSERLRALHLLATISDSSSDAIFAKDLNNRFILFNRAAEKLVGKPQAEVLGKDETTLYPPEVSQRQLADNRKVMDANLTLNIQEDVPTHDGFRSFITTKGPLHDDAGRVIGLYGIVHDITESKQAETRLRQQAAEMKSRNDELERINRAMVGRELAMIDLKRHINTLAQELGREPPFDLSFAEPEPPQ